MSTALPKSRETRRRSKWPRAWVWPTRSTRHGAPRRYDVFYAPWQYNATNHGQVGFSRRTSLSQSSAESDAPITTLDNPFPGGLQQPIGSSLGLLTGVGGSISFIDQDKGTHRPSMPVDVQRELAGEMA